MNAKLLWAALIVFMLAVTVTAATPVHRRIYWPLYIPLVVLIVVGLAANRRG
jgi:hypothetical protein